MFRYKVTSDEGLFVLIRSYYEFSFTALNCIAQAEAYKKMFGKQNFNKIINIYPMFSDNDMIDKNCIEIVNIPNFRNEEV